MPICQQCGVEYEPEGSACPVCRPEQASGNSSVVVGIVQTIGIAIISGPGVMALWLCLAFMFSSMWVWLAAITMLYAGTMFVMGACTRTVKIWSAFAGQAIGFSVPLRFIYTVTQNGFMGAYPPKGDTGVAMATSAIVFLLALPLLGTVILIKGKQFRARQRAGYLFNAFVCAVAAAACFWLMTRAWQ